jgi:hypothetical protein
MYQGEVWVGGPGEGPDHADKDPSLEVSEHAGYVQVFGLDEPEPVFSTKIADAPRGENHLLVDGISDPGQVLLLWIKSLKPLDAVQSFLDAEISLGLCLYYLYAKKDERNFYVGRVNKKLEGQDLYAYLIDESGESDVPRAYPFEARIAVAQGVLADVCRLHHHGIYHRDLKPENIMISLKDDKYCVNVMDLESCTRKLLARTHEGTEGYFPPEHFLSVSGVYSSEKRDIYALACVLLSVLFPDAFFQLINWGNSRENKRYSLFDAVGIDVFFAPGDDPVRQQLFELVLQMADRNPDKRPSAARALAIFEGVTAATPAAPVRAVTGGGASAGAGGPTPSVPAPAPVASAGARGLALLGWALHPESSTPGGRPAATL